MCKHFSITKTADKLSCWLKRYNDISALISCAMNTTDKRTNGFKS